MTRIDLVSLGGEPVVAWASGDVVTVPVADPAAVAGAVEEHLRGHAPTALLFWDRRLGPPPPVAHLLDEPDDVWHAGLALGTSGQPASIDLVAPTWMLKNL